MRNYYGGIVADSCHIGFAGEGIADILLVSQGHGNERNMCIKAVVAKNVSGESGIEIRIIVMADNFARMTYATRVTNGTRTARA